MIAPPPADPACRGERQELFFGSNADLRQPNPWDNDPHTEAKRICFTCPVIQWCASHPYTEYDYHTVRAGQRLWIRSERSLLPTIASSSNPRGHIRIAPEEAPQ